MCLYFFSTFVAGGVITKKDFSGQLGFAFISLTTAIAADVIAHFPLIRKLTGTVCTVVGRPFEFETILWNHFACVVQVVLDGFEMRNDRKIATTFPGGRSDEQSVAVVVGYGWTSCWCALAAAKFAPFLHFATSWCMGKLPLTSSAQICYFVLSLSFRQQPKYNW